MKSEHLKPTESMQGKSGSEKRACADRTMTSPYAQLLVVPTLTLVSDVYDRPDIRSVAILGYN